MWVRERKQESLKYFHTVNKYGLVLVWLPRNFTSTFFDQNFTGVLFVKNTKKEQKAGWVDKGKLPEKNHIGGRNIYTVYFFLCRIFPQGIDHRNYVRENFNKNHRPRKEMLEHFYQLKLNTNRIWGHRDGSRGFTTWGYSGSKLGFDSCLPRCF